ncbi:MAG: GTPase HflX [Myxococcales bacterium]|nr:GTPase HflX [Myxococcales bacterium]
MKVHGNVQGLGPAHRERLERLNTRKVPRDAIVSVPLAQSLCELSHEIGRQVGVTLDRRGRVKHVIVGTADALFIPDLGRARAGAGRFRGVRLVHTHLRGEPLTQDDLTDLVRLRLDLIAAVGVGRDGRPENFYYTHVLPEGAELPYAEQTATTVHALDVDFTVFIEALEEEFTRRTVGVLETEGQTRAIAVHVSLPDDEIEPAVALRELSELATTAGVVIVDAIVQKRPRPDPKYVMGQGKLDELLLRTMQLDCELVIFDQSLSPNQVRALADATEVKVIDRSMLILDIFARRARSREGKLAVELAQLKYMLPRLAHKTTAFSRLMGGVGGRGPGETKLEIDRRRARERIDRISQQLEQTVVQRRTRRGRRTARRVPVVSIIGYTNAGKSTLFNAITHSDVLVEDKLFATLDVTTRRLRFPLDRELILTDTVGFIRDLPDDLISAFKATLEEAEDADLLLHVVDIADPRMRDQIASVERILDELDLLAKPRIKVFNKIDQLDPAMADNICRLYDAFGVSALDRATLRPLLEAVEARLWQAGQAERAEADDDDDE